MGMSVAKRYRGWLPVFFAAAVIQGVFVSYRLPGLHEAKTLLPDDHPLDSPQAWSECVHVQFSKALFEGTGQVVEHSSR
jgi:hypothetical protein